LPAKPPPLPFFPLPFYLYLTLFLSVESFTKTFLQAKSWGAPQAFTGKTMFFFNKLFFWMASGQKLDNDL